MLTTIQLEDLARTARVAAETAGRYIAAEFEHVHSSMRKSAGKSLASQVVTEVDQESQRLILDSLAHSIKTYDLGLLTEEMKDDGSRFEKDYFWCIDPLDGTLPFTEQQPGFAVSVTLIDQQGQPLIGVVVDPFDEEIYQVTRGKGFTINDLSLTFQSKIEGRLVCHFDRSFEDSDSYEVTIKSLENIASKLGCTGLDIRTGPGAVMNALDLLDVEIGCYIKLPKAEQGGGCIWDFAATSLIYQELGLHVSDSFGNPVPLNSRESVYLNQTGVIYATDKRLGKEIVELTKSLHQNQ